MELNKVSRNRLPFTQSTDSSQSCQTSAEKRESFQQTVLKKLGYPFTINKSHSVSHTRYKRSEQIISPKNTQVANEDLSYSTPPHTRQRQIKTTIIYHYIPIRMV